MAVAILAACSNGGTDLADGADSELPLKTTTTLRRSDHGNYADGASTSPVVSTEFVSASDSPTVPALTDTPDIVVYKSPSCGCCSKWVTHLEAAGFNVKTENHQNMSPIKQQLGVPVGLQSCHTAKIGGYVIEGHVPAGDILRLLKIQPEVAGLAVPGMPKGSPGMEHPRPESYATIAFQQDNGRQMFARHSANGEVSYSDAF